MIKALGWETYQEDKARPFFTLPKIRVSALVEVFKQGLGCKTVRVVGDPDMLCSNIAFLPGFPGPKWQIAVLDNDNVDVLVTGEVHKWETSEFARDTVLQGYHKALIVLGHANSEEAGMAYLVDWLQPKFVNVSITHVPVGDAFHFL